MKVAVTIDEPQATEEIGVFRQQFLPTAEYSAAVVFALCDRLTQRVETLRTSMQASIVARPQLVPHLTVVYIGRRPGCQLQSIWNAVQRLYAPALTLDVEGFGSFGSGERITNLHLKVAATEQVKAMHRAGLRLLEELNETSDTQYKADAYVPHISVFDGVHIIKSTPPGICRPLVLHGQTRDLRIMARLETS